MLSVSNAECHIQALNAECNYAECHYAECHGPKNGRKLLLTFPIM
jgi:hypothetical protein